MMRLFRRNTKPSSPERLDKNDNQKEKRDLQKSVTRSIDILTTHLSNKIHNMADVNPNGEVIDSIEKISSEGKNCGFGNGFKMGSGSFSGSDENINGSSSSSSQSSETQTFVSVESNDFGDHLNQLDGEFLNTNSMSIGYNTNGFHKPNNLEQIDKEPDFRSDGEEIRGQHLDPRWSRTNQHTKFDKNDRDGQSNEHQDGTGKTEGSDDLDLSEASKGSNFRYESVDRERSRGEKRGKYIQQMRGRPGTDNSSSHYYQGPHYPHPNNQQGNNASGEYSYNYHGFHHNNGRRYPSNGIYNVKEGADATANQYVDYSQYKDDLSHSTSNKEPDSTHTDAYGSKFYPYELPSDHEFAGFRPVIYPGSGYPHDYHGFPRPNLDEHNNGFSVDPKTVVEFKPEDGHYGHKTYKQVYKPQATTKTIVKPRPRAALQILNPETGEVVNLVKDEGKTTQGDKEQESREENMEMNGNNKEEYLYDINGTRDEGMLLNGHCEVDIGTEINMDSGVNINASVGMNLSTGSDSNLNSYMNSNSHMNAISNKVGVSGHRSGRPGVQMPAIPMAKTRLRIKNKPINPSEVIFSLSEMNPHKEVSPSVREHSRSYRRKIFNVPLSSCSNISSSTSSSMASDSIPEETHGEYSTHRNLSYRNVNRMGRGQRSEYRDSHGEFSERVKDFGNKYNNMNNDKEYKYGYDFENRHKENHYNRDNYKDRERSRGENSYRDREYRNHTNNSYYQNQRHQHQYLDKQTEYRDRERSREGNGYRDREYEVTEKGTGEKYGNVEEEKERKKKITVIDEGKTTQGDKENREQDYRDNGELNISKEDKVKEDRDNNNVENKKIEKHMLQYEQFGADGTFSINTLLQIAMAQGQRYNEVLGTFKLVPLNYSISRRKVRKENKWRSELSIEKEELATCKLRRVNISKEEQYRRSIRTLLNKLTVENFLVVSEKIASLYKESLEQRQVEIIVELLHEKATLELDYSDMYADLAFLLRYSFNDVLDVGCKTTSFHKTLLNKCQDSFEEISTNQNLNKDYILGNIRFMGELFLRKILSITILKRISYTLLTSKINDNKEDKTTQGDKEQEERREENMEMNGNRREDNISKEENKNKRLETKQHLMFEPPANLIECFSELLTTIGYTVDQIPGGSEMLDEYVGILITLKNSNIYPTRINFKIQDLIDLRRRNWKKKLFKEKATSVSQIHKQVEQEQLRGSLGQEGKYITAGLQTNRHYTQYLLNKRQCALDSLVNGVYVKPEVDGNENNPNNYMLNKREGDFGHEILKLFLTCPLHEVFQSEWLKYKPTDVDVVNVFEHLLKSTLCNKTLDLCLILSELVAFIATNLVDTEIVRGKLLNMLCDRYVSRLHDEMLDNPWALIIVSKITTMLFFYSAGESRNLLEKISIPTDFPTSKKFVVNIIQGTREIGGDLGFVRRVLRRNLYSTFPQQDLLFLDEL